MGKINGFSLIETLVSVSIMALLSLTLIAIFLATIKGGIKAQKVQMVHQQGDFALSVMSKTARNSQTADCGEEGTYLLLKTDLGNVAYSVGSDESVDRIASNSGEFLTSNLVNVEDLSFICHGGDLGNQVVTISFDLVAGYPASYGGQAQDWVRQNFATSVSTRRY